METKTAIPPITPVVSSNMAGYHYDAAAQVLTVKFANGNYYAYSGVPASVAEDFEAAESKGSFFARQIRNQFPATRLESDE